MRPVQVVAFACVATFLIAFDVNVKNGANNVPSAGVLAFNMLVTFSNNKILQQHKKRNIIVPIQLLTRLHGHTSTNSHRFESNNIRTRTSSCFSSHQNIQYPIPQAKNRLASNNIISTSIIYGSLSSNSKIKGTLLDSEVPSDNSTTTTTTTITSTKACETSQNNTIHFNNTIAESNDNSIVVTSTGITENRIDKLLSRLTNLFPFFVLGSAILGIFKPSLLLWVNTGNIISIMLGGVMCGTGLSLETSDFTYFFEKKNTKSLVSIPLGIACQFIIMPLTAYVVGTLVLLPTSISTAVGVSSTSSSIIGKELFLGLILVGSCPGGTASNLVSYIANANVALSVLLTTASTFMAVFMTPLLVKTCLLLQQHRMTWTSLLAFTQKKIMTLMTQSTPSTSTIVTKAAAAATPAAATTSVTVSGSALVTATAKVVLFPVAIGMMFKKYSPPKVTNFIRRFTSFASVILVSLICGGVVAQNVSMLLSSSTAMISTVLPRVIVSVLLLHSIGFLLGYIVPKWFFQQTETTSRTISIEVGMQNSALAVVLARSIAATAAVAVTGTAAGGVVGSTIDTISTLPGALSATAHSCLGSILAAFWRNTKDDMDVEATESTRNTDDTMVWIGRGDNTVVQAAVSTIQRYNSKSDPEFII